VNTVGLLQVVFLPVPCA